MKKNTEKGPPPFSFGKAAPPNNNSLNKPKEIVNQKAKTLQRPNLGQEEQVKAASANASNANISSSQYCDFLEANRLIFL